MPKNKSALHQLGVCLIAAATVWMFSQAACRCSKDPYPTPVPDVTDTGGAAPAPSPVPAPSPTAVPTAASSPPDARPPAVPVVEDLNVIIGHWGGGEGEESSAGFWAELASREAAKKAKQPWGIPYPWRLTLKAYEDKPPFDCGLFEKVEGDGWRVGYCLGGDLPVKGERIALRIYLRRPSGHQQLLHVKIGNAVELILDR